MTQTAATSAAPPVEASLATAWNTIQKALPRANGIYAGLCLLAGGAIVLAGSNSFVAGIIFAIYAALLWLIVLVLIRRSVATPLARLTARLGEISLTPEAAERTSLPPTASVLDHADRLEEAVSEMSRRVKFEFRTLVENAIIGVAILQDGRIRFANRAAASLVGAERPEDLVLLESAVDLLPEADRTRADRLGALMQARAGAHARLTLSFPRYDGSRRWVQTHLQQVTWRGKAGLMASLIDITRQKRLEEDLRHLATYDALTGAINRRHFLDQASVEIDRARRHGRPLALLLLDLDHFKKINDTLGHAAGDIALKQVTKAIWRHLREIDMVARIGGEEFAVLLPDTNLEGAIILAERLRHRIETLSIQTGGSFISLSASVGIADAVGTHDETISEALRRVDMALYRAKREGRNRVSVAAPSRPPFAGEGI